MNPRSFMIVAALALYAQGAFAEIVGADSRHAMNSAVSAAWLEQSRMIAGEIYENDYIVTTKIEEEFERRALAKSGEERLESLNFIIHNYLGLGYEDKAENLLETYDRLTAAEGSLRHRKAARILHFYRKSLGGQYKTAAEEISRAIAEETDAYVIATASSLGAYAWADSGFPSKAFELIRRGRDAAESLSSNEAVLSGIHDAWSYASLAAGDFASSIAQTKLSLEFAAKAGVPVDGVSTLYNLALIATDQEEFAAAREFAAMEFELAGRTGIAEEAFFASYLCAMVSEASDDFAKAERCANEAITSPAAVDDYLTGAMGIRISALARLGRAKEARTLLEDVRSKIDAQAAPRDAIALRALEARVLFAERKYEAAIKEYEAFHRASKRLSEANFNDGVRELRAGLESDLEAERVRAAANAQEAAFMSERIHSQQLLLTLSALLFLAAIFALVSHGRNARRLADAKKAAEAANRAKSEFLAAMSHELRTPLNGVLGMAQSLAADSLPADQRTKVSTILDSGATLLSLLNDVLDLSKIEAGHMEISPIDGDLESAVGRLVELFRPLAAERGNHIEFIYAESAPKWAKFDPVRVRQCVSNLISNAVKFTENGKIRVEVAAGDGAGRTPVTITVADSGIGMSKAVVANLFNAYSQGDASITRKYGGTGLGLAIARRIARLMDGDIAVESEPGRGSVMTLSFVAGQAECKMDDRADAPEGEATSLAISGKRVLVVDDVLVNRQVARLFLKPLGVIVAEAASGEEALSHLAEHEADIILLDIQMPVLDGYETARRIRQLQSPNADAVVVALTAGVMDDEEDRCLAAGMDGFAAKPLDIRTLTSVIATAQDRRRRLSRAVA